MGAQRGARDEAPDHAAPDSEFRIVQLADGMRWRVSVVARLISEDITAGHESARLILQLECLSARRRALRAAVPGARALADVSERVLRALIAQPAPRRGSGAFPAARKPRR